MRFCIYTILCLISIREVQAQCNYKDYEKYISEECIDCKQYQVNNFLYKKCQEADSMLAYNRACFYKKIVAQMNSSKSEKRKVEEAYDRSYDALIKARGVVFKNYDSLTNSGDNRYYTQLFYWYFTDKVIEVLKDIESTVLGD